MEKKSRPVAPEQAEANADAIRKLWRAGRASQRRLDKLTASDPAAIGYGRCEDTYAAEAKVFGRDIDTTAKTRRIAADFTEADIERICKLVVRYRPPFGPTHLMRSLRVPAGEQRDDLIRQAIRGRWTSVMVARHAQALKRGRRAKVGRHPTIPKNRTELLVTLDAAVFKFRRFSDAAKPGLPRHLHAVVDGAIAAADRVSKAVAAHLSTTRVTKGKKK